MSRRSSIRSLPSLLLCALLVALVAVPVVAHGPQAPQPPRGWGGEMGRQSHGLEVLHGPVTVTLADRASDGHQLGDLRVTSVPTTDAFGRALGRLDATLVTTAIDAPGPGDEIRISSLVFSFGDSGEHQVVVGGSAVYPAQGATLATGAVTTRPIQGGSGRFAGADGWAVSERLEDDSWRHTLVFTGVRSAAKAMPRGHRQGPGAFALGLLRRHLAEQTRERARTHPDVSPSPEKLRSGAQPSIVRTELGMARPDSAPGQDLGLWHYTIPAGSTLEPHRHPGVQIAHITRGELSYTVSLGEATVVSADGSARVIGLGTHTLRAGETVIEQPDLEHYGANRTHKDVEIMASTLYPEGAPLAIPVPTPHAAAPSASPSP